MTRIDIRKMDTRDGRFKPAHKELAFKDFNNIGSFNYHQRTFGSYGRIIYWNFGEYGCIMSFLYLLFYESRQINFFIEILLFTFYYFMKFFSSFYERKLLYSGEK